MVYFGTTKNGQKVHKYTLSNGGVTAEIIDYGATVVSLKMPDKNGKLVDGVLGYDSFEQYETLPGLGTAVGRVCNRIDKARFTLDGVEYKVKANDGENCLHGGGCFDRAVFTLKESGDNFIVLRYVSPDGENGFMGELTTDIKYTVTTDGALQIEYFAVSNKNTVISLTNHSYFNLSGDKYTEKSIYDQYLMIDADNYLETDDKLIPTGNFIKTEGEFDFKTYKKIGQDIEKNNPDLKKAGGYDHNFCLNNKGKYALIASAYSSETGVKMDVFTDMPGVQLYSGNYLDKKNVFPYRSAFCLETQGFPNAVNRPEFPSIKLIKNEKYYTKTVYKFSTVETNIAAV